MKNYRIYIVLFLIGIVLYTWSRVIYASPEQNSVKIVFMDVGQGDATLALLPGGKQLLVDGGPDDSVLAELGKYMPPFDNEIEYVVLTHPHADHLTGLNKVLQKYKIGTIYEGQGVSTSATYKLWKSEIEKLGIGDTVLSSGTTINLGGVATFNVLAAGVSDNLNNTSVIGRLQYQNTAIMLPGDAEVAEQTGLCDLSESDLKSNVLKVAHHGSSTGSVKCFLDKVRPDIAVISVGKDNKYGHPHSEALNLLSNYTNKILRTDLMGAVVCSDNGVSVSCK